MNRKKRFLPSAQTLSFIVLMAVCYAVFGLLRPAYLPWSNIYSMILTASVTAVLALAMGVVISAGGFDLSIGHTAGFAALMCGYFIRATDLRSLLPTPWGTWICILLSVLLAVVIGAFNGFVVVKLGINSFIVTLSTQFILQGVRQWITKGDSYRADNTVKSITQGVILGHPNLNLVIISVCIVIIVGFIMQKTSFGRKMQFVGSNITCSRYIGVNIHKYTFLSFLISGLIAGIGGILQFSKLTTATINIGDGWLFNAMTVAVFSNTIFNRFKIHGIALVAILITMITTGINMLGVSSAWTNFVLGLILLMSLIGGKYLHLDRFKTIFQKRSVS